MIPKKRFVKIITIVIVLSILLILSSGILRPSNTDNCVAAVKSFHELPSNSVDVIFFGSSHVWRGVDVLEMYEKYGIGAYNYGCNWQTLSTEALFFFDALRTQNPQVVFFDTYRINDIKSNQAMDGEIYYTRYIPTFPYKKKYLRTAFGNDLERYVAYSIPLTQLHSNWNSISAENFYNWYSEDEFINTMGYSVTPFSNNNVAFDLVDMLDCEPYELSFESQSILDEIVEACNTNNIQLVFITIPWNGHNHYHDALTAYTQTNNCTYLDLYQYLDVIGIDDQTCFSDDAHLNSRGAKKIGSFLGKYIRDHYDIKDMRNVKNNLWTGKSENLVGVEYANWLDSHPQE